MSAIRLQLSLDEVRIENLLISGFQGINYWARIVDYKGVKPRPPWSRHLGTMMALRKNCAVHIRAPEGGPCVVLNREKVKRGLKTMATKYPKHFGDFLSGAFDAHTGDVFIQCCVFGSVIYG